MLLARGDLWYLVSDGTPDQPADLHRRQSAGQKLSDSRGSLRPQRAHSWGWGYVGLGEDGWIQPRGGCARGAPSVNGLRPCCYKYRNAGNWKHSKIELVE